MGNFIIPSLFASNEVLMDVVSSKSWKEWVSRIWNILSFYSHSMSFFIFSLLPTPTAIARDLRKLLRCGHSFCEILKLFNCNLVLFLDIFFTFRYLFLNIFNFWKASIHDIFIIVDMSIMSTVIPKRLRNLLD